MWYDSQSAGCRQCCSHCNCKFYMPKNDFEPQSHISDKIGFQRDCQSMSKMNQEKGGGGGGVGIKIIESKR